MSTKRLQQRATALLSLLLGCSVIAAACGGDTKTRTVTETATVTATVEATVTVTATATATVTAPPALTSGTYVIESSGLALDGCNFVSSYWDLASDADVVVSGSSMEVALDIGDTYVYSIDGTALRDVDEPGLFAFACTQSDAQGVYACGDQAFEAAVSVFSAYRGSIEVTDTFVVEDFYEYACDGPDCDAVATQVLGDGFTFPCVTIDTAEFAKEQ